MNLQRRPGASALALWAVAALLLANLAVTAFWRNDLLAPAALAQRQPPIAGGAGMFVMPAQLTRDMWGCYLMDIDRGTLCVYQFHPGTKKLEFMAARQFIQDARLANYNTFPTPQEIVDLVNKQNQMNRGGAVDPGAGIEPPRDNP